MRRAQSVARARYRSIFRPASRSSAETNPLGRGGLHRTAGRGRQRQRRIAAKRGSHCYSARDATRSATSSARGRAAARPRQPRSADGKPPPPPTAPVTQAPAAPRPVGARPSFDCGNARTRARSPSAPTRAWRPWIGRWPQYGRAMAVASPEQQALLRRTRDRFLGFRDRCADNRCIGDAYTGRMREIRDIMEGRWQAPR